MFNLSSQIKYYLYSEPVDMRKSFDGLSGLVTNHMHKNPNDISSAYLFVNKNRNLLKLLHYEGNGITLYYKRLNEGSFSYAKSSQITDHQSCLNLAELVVLLQGLSLSKIIKKRVRNPQK